MKARSWLAVDAKALVANARALAATTAPSRFCAVIKSNAYGHGLEPVARILAGAGIPHLQFAVFNIGEGLALRAAGIQAPILVLGPAGDDEISPAAIAGLDVAVLDDDDPRRFAPFHPRMHVKVETGIHRFGVTRDAAGATIERCRDLGLDVAGVYSHLANAEELDYEFTMAQVRALKSIELRSNARSGQARPLHNPVLHIAASAAAMLWPETRLDLVRCGIAVYGFWPSSEVRRAMAERDPSFKLTPALAWYAPVVQTRQVAAGEPVGYGCAFTPERETRIAVLPAGYADGLPRAAGEGRAAVFFEGQSAPIVGRVCMNAVMVDITGLRPQPEVGDTAELDIEDLATAAGTINYEILARLSPQLQRTYD